MSVVVNGVEYPVEPGTTVEDIVEELSANPQGVAVAVNRVVIARRDWSTRTVDSGDTIEVLTAAAGG